MKRALVISGGGSKGAFAVGVLRNLFANYPNLDFDIYVGTSTGALIVPLVALGEMELLEDLYTNQETGDIVIKHRLGDRLGADSVFDAEPLRSLLLSTYTDQRYNDLLATNKTVLLNTTSLQTEELHVFSTSPAILSKYYQCEQLQNASQFRRAVMASASQPVFMSPVLVNEKIPGHPRRMHQYVDGGVKEYAGVQMAIDHGATEIFTILLSTGLPVNDTGQFDKIPGIMMKTIDILIDDVSKNDLIIPSQYNEALLYIEAVKNKMKRSGLSTDQVNEFFRIRGRENPYEDKIPLGLFTFRPDAPLGGGEGGLTFSPAEMKTMMAKGEQAASDLVGSLDPSEITWV